MTLLRKYFLTGLAIMAAYVIDGARAQQLSAPFRPDTAFCSTQGAIAYRNASKWVCLNPGSSGNVLQSGGAAANPSWVVAAGGGNVSTSGTPTANQFATWFDGTHIQGVTGGGALLDQVSGMASTGIVRRTGSGTYTQGGLLTIAEGGTGNNSAGFALDSTGGFSTNGILRRTGTGTYTAGTAITNAELATAADSTIKSNISGATAAPSDNTISAVLDKQFGSTQGEIVFRGAAGWQSLAPGTATNLLQTNGAGANPSWVTAPTGSGGSVTQVTAGQGMTTGAPGTTGGNITVNGTLTPVEPVNAQASTYTVATTDQNKLINLTGSGLISLPQATGSFAAGFAFDAVNNGTDIIAFTPTTSTINGAASLSLPVGVSAHFVSDGSNWIATNSTKAGGRYLLATLTASASASLQDTAHITSLFDQYELVFENIVAGTSAAIPNFTVQANGSFQTTSYNTDCLWYNSTGPAAISAVTTNAVLGTGLSTSATTPYNATVRLYNPTNSGVAKAYTANANYVNSAATYVGAFCNGFWNNTTFAVTGISFQLSAGTITSGTLKIYGLN